MQGLGAGAHRVGRVDVHDLRDRQCLLLATVGGDDDYGRLPLAKSRQSRFLRGVARLERGHARLQGLHVGPARHALELESAQPETDVLLLVVDRADITALDASDIAAQACRLRQPPLELADPWRRAGRAPLADLLHGADQPAPLGALDHDHVGGNLAPGDLRLVGPHEILAVEIAVGDADLDAVLAGFPRDTLARGDRPGEHLAVLERDAHDRRGPEEAERADDDDADQPGHHDERHRQRTSREPDERLATAPERFHR